MALGNAGTPQPALHGPFARGTGGGGGTAKNMKHPVKSKGGKKAKKKGSKGDGGTDWFQNPLTDKQAKKQVHADSYQKYHNQFSDLQNELAVSKTMQKRTEQWYDDYKREVNRATQRSQNIYNQAENAVRGFSDQSAAQAAQMQSGLNDAAQRDAQLRGTTVDPSIAQTGAMAQMSRRNIQGAALGNLATHGAANTVYLSNQARNVAAEKLLAHQEEAGRARKLRKDRRDLHAEQGAFRISDRNQLRATERNWWLAKKTLAVNEDKNKIAAALADANFQEKVHHNRALEASSRHDDMLADKKYRLDVKKFGAKQAAAIWKREHPKGSGGSKGGSGRNGFTPAAIHKAKSTLRTWTAKAESYRRSHPGSTQQQAYKDLLRDPTAPDPIIAYAATQRAYFHGKVGPKTREQLWKNFGFHVPQFSSRKDTGGTIGHNSGGFGGF